MSEARNIIHSIHLKNVGFTFKLQDLHRFGYNPSNAFRTVGMTNCILPTTNNSEYKLMFKPTPTDLTGCKNCKRLQGNGGCPPFEKAYAAS
jgi:hypothetical protein